MMSGIILITVPTIQYGGYFLLTSLMNKGSGYMGTNEQRRANRTRSSTSLMVLVRPVESLSFPFDSSEISFPT